MRVYQYNDISDVWELMGNELNSTEYNYGIQVSISSDGRTLAVLHAVHQGGFGWSVSLPAFANSAGTIVQVYEFNGAYWAQKGAAIENLERTASSRGMALSGDGEHVSLLSLVHANGIVSPTGPFWTLSTHTFQPATSNWSTDCEEELQLQPYINDNLKGIPTVSMSSNGTVVVIGNPTNTLDSGGIVQIFEKTSQATGFQNDETLIGSFSDWLGQSVSVSADGRTIAYSVTHETKVSRKDAYVKVIRKTNNGWHMLGSQPIVSDQQNIAIRKRDRFGSDVSLSSRGNWIAISSSGDLDLTPPESEPVNPYVSLYQYMGQDGWDRRGRIEGNASSIIGTFGNVSILVSLGNNMLTLGTVQSDSVTSYRFDINQTDDGETCTDDSYCADDVRDGVCGGVFRNISRRCWCNISNGYVVIHVSITSLKL